MNRDMPLWSTGIPFADTLMFCPEAREDYLSNVVRRNNLENGVYDASLPELQSTHAATAFVVGGALRQDTGAIEYLVDLIHCVRKAPEWVAPAYR